MAFSQDKLEVGTVIQESKITKFNSQNLILIDFWATWCAPCVPAGEQLETYQSQLKDDIYIIGISDENKFKIKRFISSQQVKMAIYQDHNSSNIKRYNVKYRPYSIILNNNGNLVWKGSPTELNVNFIKKLSRKVKNRNYKLKDIFHYNYNKQENLPSEIDTLDIFSKEYINKIKVSQLNKTSGRVYFEGDILSFYSKLLGLPKASLQTDIDLKIKFGTKLSIWENNKEKIKNHIKNYFNIFLEKSKKVIKFNEFDVVNSSMLWDKSQISWSNEGESNYIIGENRIKADNLTISEICNILSDLKDIPFYYNGSDEAKYDWDFHYNYDNLMIEELKYQFGIQLNKGIEKQKTILNIKKSNF
jgi:thiol-disulfide isomerase/thioredoxin